jgi:hypothetical protein
MVIENNCTTVSSESTGIPSSRNNNLVAESDYHAAVAALRDKLDTKVSANSDPVFRKLLSDCSNSLTVKIQKIVQPVSDEAFHVYLTRYKDDRLSCPSENEYIASGKEEQTEDATALSATSVEFDEEELIDQVAVARVQELRQQVREQASTVLKLRAETLRRAVSLTERQVHLWENQARSLKKTKSSEGLEGSDAASLLEQHKAAVQDTKQSLYSLHQSIQDTGSILPNKLQSFQATLRDIESSLNKQQNGSISQIEKAIYSRDYKEQQSQYNDDATETEDKMDFQVLDPEEKLAYLLCQF